MSRDRAGAAVALAIVLAGCLSAPQPTTGAPSHTTPTAPTTPPPMSDQDGRGLVLTASADRASVASGERVNVSALVENRGSEARAHAAGCSGSWAQPPFEFTVADASGAPVWRAPPPYPMCPTFFATLPPGGTVARDFTWDGTRDLGGSGRAARGSYELLVNASFDNDTTVLRVKIAIAVD